MRFLVTGGNGFIGCYISKALKTDGHEVTTLGRSSMNDIVVDLSISTYQFQIDFDYIIHTAGIVHKEEHIKSFNTNLILKDIAITENLLKSIAGINFNKIIYLSSVSVYGLITGYEIGVNTPPKPIDGYGFSKLINEKIIQSKIELCKVLIVRLPLVNGPNAKGNIRKAQHALKKKRMVLFNENNSLKSILEISDLYSFIIDQSKDINGIQQIKSYDINFNDFILSLSSNKPLILPKGILQFGIRVSKFLFLRNLNKTLRKISTTLTFKNSI
jgi:nucleoside-diphosphate-sugar epimerase